ncbi:MAG: S9 family peptidase [Holophagales bacterium]|jgi:prolyl oligopeptidase|nr:S9 family peptidase [Holophagales bacterium]
MTLDDPKTEPAAAMVSFGSVSFEDPDAWLEEETETVLSWQAEQDARAASWLAARPGFADLCERIAALDSNQAVSAPQYGGGRWFRQRVPEGEDLAILEVAETPTGEGRRVVDLNVLRTSEPLLIPWFVPSPDGRRLAYSRSAVGREPESFQVIDVETGELLLAGVPQERATSPVWLPDGSGFTYRAIDPAVSKSDSLIFHLTLGEAPPTKPEPLDLGHPMSWPASAAGGRYVLVYSNHMEPRPDFIREIGGAWRPFLKAVPGMFRGVVLGEKFIAITTDGAARGRLVSIPLDTPSDRDAWQELVPGSDAVLASIAAVGQRLVLVELVDTYARLRVLGADGQVEGEIALPGRGVVNTTSTNAVAIAFLDCVAVGGDDDVVFVYSSLTQAPALYRASVVDRTSEPLTPPGARLDALVTDHSATSADGTRVRYRVVTRKDDRSGSRPTIVHAHGGFNVAFLPGWPVPFLAAWVRSGGALVIAHVRGGGEFGPDWWRAGQLARKQNGFDDLYAVAEDLVARGVTMPGRLGVYGTSSGGTLAAVAAVKRPDLFRAAVPQVPITDQFALVRDPLTWMIARLEDGDPNEPEMSRVLLSWSPYQNVVDGVAYPAVLLDCVSNEPRCPAWHGRKLAARMQRATSSGRPVLLRVRRSAGQRAVGEAAQRLQQAELLAFFVDQLGLPT